MTFKVACETVYLHDNMAILLNTFRSKLLDKKINHK